MSEAFEILSDALDEAIADAKDPKLARRIVSKEISPPEHQGIKKSNDKRRLLLQSKPTKNFSA